MVQRQLEPEPEEKEKEEEVPIQGKLVEGAQVQRQEEEPLAEEEGESESVPAEAGSEMEPIAPEEEREQEDENTLLQAKQVRGATPDVGPNIEAQIRSLEGGGKPLSNAERSFFEPRFGYDFSQVRVHTHKQAADTARTLRACAFTRGSDIIFGSGQYYPHTKDGKRLLAHELTHVIQQNRASKAAVAHKGAHSSNVFFAIRQSTVQRQQALSPARGAAFGYLEQIALPLLCTECEEGLQQKEVSPNKDALVVQAKSNSGFSLLSATHMGKTVQSPSRGSPSPQHIQLKGARAAKRRAPRRYYIYYRKKRSELEKQKVGLVTLSSKGVSRATIEAKRDRIRVSEGALLDYKSSIDQNSLCDFEAFTGRFRKLSPRSLYNTKYLRWSKYIAQQASKMNKQVMASLQARLTKEMEFMRLAIQLRSYRHRSLRVIQTGTHRYLIQENQYTQAALNMAARKLSIWVANHFYDRDFQKKYPKVVLANIIDTNKVITALFKLGQTQPVTVLGITERKDVKNRIIFQLVVDLVWGFIPVIGDLTDVAEGIAGIDKWGNKLGPVERSLMILGGIIPFLPGGALRGTKRGAALVSDVAKTTGKSASKVKKLLNSVKGLSRSDADKLRRLVHHISKTGNKLSASQITELNRILVKLRAPSKVSAIRRAAVAILKPLRAFPTLRKGREWAVKALKIPISILKDLSLPAINRLRRLPAWALDRLRQFNTAAKRWILGCTSPCKVDLLKIMKYMKELSPKSRRGAKLLNSVADVLNALPAGINKRVIRSKLLRHPALMKAIQKAKLADVDLWKLADFLTTVDRRKPREAYKTFVRYLTSVIPARIGPDIRKLNEIAKAMVKAQRKMGSALKGPMFEKFAHLYLVRFRNLSMRRIVFNSTKRVRLSRWKRSSDFFVDATNELWEFKHHLSKVPLGQAQDYKKILLQGLRSTDGKIIRSVNYLFPSKAAAEANRFLLTKFGFNVYYVRPPNNVMLLR